MTVAALRAELERELTDGILPYWSGRALDHERGGVVGLIDGDDVPHPDAPKGAVLHARVLWTFSAAYRALGRPAYRAVAEHALRFVRERLADPEHGGVFWMVAADGRPLDDRKHVYAQAFAIYALAEHARATGDAASLTAAMELFALVERHARDVARGGYEEAFARDWSPLADVRLSDVDANERRSTNTHLHLVEAYATLLRARPDPLLRARLAELLELFLARIVDPPTHHLRLCFDEDWTPKSRVVSFGHDIEASWLLLDAADALGDPALRVRVQAACVRMAEAVRVAAVDPAHGGLFYERDADGVLVTDKEWWPQAEAIVGFVSAWRETGRASFRDAALGVWAFTRRYVVDAAHGEWRRRVSRDGVPRPGQEKAGPWKCPYHNARACLEIMARLGDATDASAA